jgi:CO dehydrogenase/acetyl-CoA synthase beta subunit
MQLYDEIIDEIKILQNQKASEGKLNSLEFSNTLWPAAGDRNLILQSDTAIEVGNPADEAVSLCLWTERKGVVADNQITLIGPDISPLASPRLPFGKIVLLRGKGFDEDNVYDRYRQMDLIRFDVSLKGYMMRATAQYMREWSRISKDAVDKGFSFSTLGNALIAEFKKIDYIDSVEVIFITSSDEDVFSLSPMATQTDKINKAMSKMIEEMSANCEDCEYEEICDEVAALRNIRKAQEKRRS